MEILLIKYIKSNWKIIIITLLVAVITPIIIGFVLNIPTGDLTIGNESSWVGFFGSYTGGIIGGIVALIISSSQLINERKKFNISQRSYLSAATIVADFSEKEFNRKKKNRIALTRDYTSLTGTNHKTTYYSVIRYGGPDIITNCQFKITVGNDMKFEKIDTIKVWIDFFEKDEEILIPLCSDKLSEKCRYRPFVKEIEVVFDTLAGEKIIFYQSEKMKKEHIRWSGAIQKFSIKIFNILLLQQKENKRVQG
ncbi:UNVERIFIED_CONTAM: hypothetical protein N8J90_01075 [Halobacillus marinus]